MKVYFETLGCPKNFYDTQTAGGILEAKGHEVIDNPDEADVIIVNTCGFINDAKTESIEAIFDMAKYKENGAKLIVSGCLAQRYSEELFEEIPEADAFIGVNNYDMLPEIIENTDGREKFVSECTETELPALNRKFDSNVYTSTLKIAEGCNNRCTYCIIPYIRGNYRSKKMENILSEARELAAAGCKELILIAQDTTYYGKDLYDEFKLPELLRELCKIDGIRWIRLMYCYEDRITDELIETIASEEKICNYLDIPIQHASDNVLQAMNRRSTESTIKSTLDKLRSGIEDIHIRTTLITGFPGETEEDFDILYDFVEEQQFARLGVFAYSQEEGTPAAEMENQIDEEVKQQRADDIMRMQLDISYEYNKVKIGSVMEVIVDEIDEDGSYIGRTRFDAPEIDNSVIFTSTNQLVPGDIVNVVINDAFDYDLVGKEV